MASNIKSFKKSPKLKSKAVVGKAKHKLNWKNKLFFGSALFTLLLAGAYTGFQWLEYKQLKAKAGGYTYVGGGSFTGYACKVGYTSNIRYFIRNGTYNSVYLDMNPYNAGSKTAMLSYKNGYISYYSGDFRVRANGVAYGSSKSWGNIAFC